MPDGISLLIRPIRPEDALIEREFVRHLSTESKYLRFMHALTDLTPEMLARFTQIDYDREMALIALVKQDEQDIEIGVARYVINADGVSCEFAIVVADEWRHRGIAGRLMDKLLESARDKGLALMEGSVLANNKEMITFCKSMEFVVEPDTEDPHLVRVRKKL